jgi:hypothetical protein
VGQVYLKPTRSPRTGSQSLALQEPLQLLQFHSQSFQARAVGVHEVNQFLEFIIGDTHNTLSLSSIRMPDSTLLL